MEAVTGKKPFKSEVMQLAEKIIQTCREHTTSMVVAVAAAEIAEKVMTSEELRSFESLEEPALSAEAPERLPLVP